mmetsp:Transcript_65852/g.157102  ORF Transcript_65852/g.157102 Transcript_65852/m.157102 type:complete len:88 (+) Transcript_65852:98-361(+)|eukprot:CAMPEP_0180157288 /NCGR_PEP_ID=MMETSP0986-20121125/26135_1 /TAXON_ID=697907 /ORGANISM="non described non described, Strain CCMP2293" /LENGTH=87 /DNA_ID=CAMNT_0022106745 /DNA_START=89 /DNA_END=352 /DNA_ORIENTATION=+
MGSDDEGGPPAKPGASKAKAEKLETSFKKAVGGKLSLKGGIDFKTASGKKKKKKKDGSEVVEVAAATRESELDTRVKKKSDRFCMHT